MTAAQLAARRKGGLALKERRGLEFYAELGRRYGHLGGRPRAMTFKEVELAQSRERNAYLEDRGGPSTDSLPELRRRLWAKRLSNENHDQMQSISGRMARTPAELRLSQMRSKVSSRHSSVGTAKGPLLCILPRN